MTSPPDHRQRVLRALERFARKTERAKDRAQQKPSQQAENKSGELPLHERDEAAPSREGTEQ